MNPVITRVVQPDLGPPSSAAWMTARLPVLPTAQLTPPQSASRWYAGETRVGEPDPGPPSASARIFSALPVSTLVQQLAALGHGLDPPAAVPAPADTYLPTRSMFWFRTFSQIKGVDEPRIWQPAPWPVDTTPALGWLTRTAVTIAQHYAARSQSQRESVDVRPSAPFDPTPSIPWVITTFPVATTPQLTGVWSQAKAADPWSYQAWLPEPVPYTSFIAKLVIVPATIPQQAGIWSQRTALDPWAAPNYAVDPSLWPSWWQTFLIKPPKAKPGKVGPQWIRRRRLYFGI